MEAIISVVVEIGKCLRDPLQRRVRYLTHFHNYVKDLKDGLKDLSAAKRDLEASIETGRLRGEEQTEKVTLWLERAVAIEKEAQQIEKEAEENRKCLCFPNMCWRYSKSKRAKEKVDLINKLNVAEWKLDDRVTMPPLPPPVQNQQARPIAGLPSVELSLQKVMNALDDPRNKTIGVWGMGGVGKTTLVQHVNNQLEGTRKFNKVIMVTVSRDVKVKRLQDEIASRLGLTLNNDSSRAIDLRNRLMQEKTFLLILDDLWERLELTDVGIPCVNDLDSCKIILTTRRETVCNAMETQVNIKVNVLSDDESFKLFREKVGDAVDELTLHSTAMEVLKECGGLPLAIITVGRALRNKRAPESWNNALARLKKSEPSDIPGMEDKVYGSIKLSYEYLRPVLQPAFLFCCLFPEDYVIDVDMMVRQWKGEGLLEDAESLEEVLNRGHAWVDELRDACLLLDADTGFVKVHDIIRDVGISISSKDTAGDYKSLVQTGTKLKGFPQGQEWHEYKRISLMDCDHIKELGPEGEHCPPQLLTLLMRRNQIMMGIRNSPYRKVQSQMQLNQEFRQRNQGLMRIQGGFFEGKKALRVLDLSKTGITELPSSLSNLVNLRVLLLSGCWFRERECLSPLGGLEQLEFLDLSDNFDLEGLPNEIGKLVNLRSLDLSRNYGLTYIPNDFPSSLSRLEELRTIDTKIKWSYSSVAKLVSFRNFYVLELLIVFDVNVTNPEVRFNSLSSLKKFSITLVPNDSSNAIFYFDRTMRDLPRTLDITDMICFFSTLALELLPHAMGLRVRECYGLRTLGSVRQLPDLEHLFILSCYHLQHLFEEEEAGVAPTLYLEKLRHLKIHYCHLLKHIMPSFLLERMKNLAIVELSWCNGVEHVFSCGVSNRKHVVLLPKLETLDVYSLPTMTSMWAAGLVLTLPNLTALSISNCTQLNKCVLSSSMHVEGGLPNLQRLDIESCDRLEEIISDVDENKKSLFFPKLKHLRLKGLPQLVRICGGGGGGGDAAAAAAAQLQLDWHSLEVIDVYGCHKLKKLQPLQGGLPNLQTLEIQHCGKLEEIISDADENKKSLFFPKLKHLRLKGLPQLVMICGGGGDAAAPRLQLDWHSLEEIFVHDCPKLKKLQPLQGGTQGVPLLQEIKCEREWWEGLDWDGDDAIKAHFQPKFS